MRQDNPYALPHELFVVGFRPQTEWMWLIATAFFLGELGAGLFLVSMLAGFPLGMVLGLLVVLVGKNTAHLMYLGRPERFWRALSNPVSSWISRGFFAMAAFAVFGALYAAMSLGYVPLETSGSAGQAIKLVAGAAALLVMIYDGFVLSYSPAIQLWNTALLPVLFGTYAMMGGTTLTLLLTHLGLDQRSISGDFLEPLELVLILANLAMLGVYVMTSVYSSVAARFAVQRLVKEYSLPFFGGVIVLGLLITLLLSLYFATSKIVYVLFGAAAAELVGDFLVILLVLKAGVFAPLVPESDF
ncbi:MAG: polysulfide reductase NrfD [Chloroflexi bacterium]|nr:polysulfide reductase NrfD [Chloroflexota bacterium]